MALGGARPDADERVLSSDERFQTHAGSEAFSNASIAEIQIDGMDALLVMLYLFTKGSRGGEDEELIFYRTLPAKQPGATLRGAVDGPGILPQRDRHQHEARSWPDRWSQGSEA